MKQRLLVVVLILVVVSMFTMLSAQAFVRAKLVRSRDVAVQLVYTDSPADVAGTAVQVAWRSGIRTLRFRRV